QSHEQAGMRVLPMNKQGCVFYQRRTSRDACQSHEQAGMRVLPMNKQGCAPRSHEQAGMRVLPMNKQFPPVPLSLGAPWAQFAHSLFCLKRFEQSDIVSGGVDGFTEGGF
ncbi:MAG: hypothetical protein ACPGWR_26695, partial [Ardenticatenaceae bacterium]